MKTRIGFMALAIGLLALLMSVSLYSLPRLATEHGAPCSKCHVSPNGGGMRNEFGHATSYNELALQQTRKYLGDYKATSRLNDNITFGADYRLLYEKNLSFFRMQTDFYMSLEMLKHITFNFTLAPSNMRESYVLIKPKGDQYWIKAGEFTPAFGLHDADHNEFIETVPLILPQVSVDGVSLGGNFFNGSNITVEYYRPNGQSVGTFHSFRAGYLGKLGFLVGLSWRQSEKLAQSSYGAFPIAKAFFGGLNYDRLTALAEIEAVGVGNEQRVFYSQLEGKVIDGLYLLAEYNWHDPDTHLKTGTNQYYKFSCEFFPVPFIEIRPSVVVEKLQFQSKFTNRYLVQLHVNY
jgi:hypothetical protein